MTPEHTLGFGHFIAQADVATRVNKDSKTGELVEAISETGTSRR